jgi:hypothetical protein
MPGSQTGRAVVRKTDFSEKDECIFDTPGRRAR